jgi:hypothetical protein
MRTSFWAVLALLSATTFLLACTRQPPPIQAANANALFEAAWLRLSSELHGNEPVTFPNDSTKIAQRLEKESASLEAFANAFAGPGFAPFGGEHDDNELEMLARLKTSCWLLTLDACCRIEDKQPDQAIDRLSSVLKAVTRLVAEKRGMASLAAIAILSKNLSAFEGILANPLVSERLTHILRDQVAAFDSIDPMGFAPSLGHDAEVLQAKLFKVQLAEAKQKRDAGEYLRPQDGMPPDDAELERFMSAQVDKIWIKLEAFLREVTAVSNTDDAKTKLKLLVERAHAGEFGSLAPILADSVLSSWESHKNFLPKWAKLQATLKMK